MFRGLFISDYLSERMQMTMEMRDTREVLETILPWVMVSSRTGNRVTG